MTITTEDVAEFFVLLGNAGPGADEMFEEGDG